MWWWCFVIEWNNNYFGFISEEITAGPIVIVLIQWNCNPHVDFFIPKWMDFYKLHNEFKLDCKEVLEMKVKQSHTYKYLIKA